MIDVIAIIHVKPGHRKELLTKLKANVPNVVVEEGCKRYDPSVDIDSGIARQVKDENVIVVIEQWSGLDALHAHLTAPHMARYREEVKDLVENVEELKVLERA